MGVWGGAGAWPRCPGAAAHQLTLFAFKLLIKLSCGTIRLEKPKECARALGLFGERLSVNSIHIPTDSVGPESTWLCPDLSNPARSLRFPASPSASAPHLQESLAAFPAPSVACPQASAPQPPSRPALREQVQEAAVSQPCLAWPSLAAEVNHLTLESWEMILLTTHSMYVWL